MKLETESLFSVFAPSEWPSSPSPSDDNETEWKEEVDDAGIWPCLWREVDPDLDAGGYECSTVSVLGVGLFRGFECDD